jgi:hypothetical protein
MTLLYVLDNVFITDCGCLSKTQVAVEVIPKHLFGLPTVVVDDSRSPSQPFADSVGPPCCPVIPGIPLAEIGHLVATLAGEDAATLQDLHKPTAATDRAEKTGSLSAKGKERFSSWKLERFGRHDFGGGRLGSLDCVQSPPGWLSNSAGS